VKADDGPVRRTIIVLPVARLVMALGGVNDSRDFSPVSRARIMAIGRENKGGDFGRNSRVTRGQCPGRNGAFYRDYTAKQLTSGPSIIVVSSLNSGVLCFSRDL